MVIYVEQTGDPAGLDKCLTTEKLDRGGIASSVQERR
jgi:hypothetical protein